MIYFKHTKTLLVDLIIFNKSEFFLGNPICRCEPGLIPKPDTITGCGPECTRDPECQQGYVCQSQRCVPRPGNVWWKNLIDFNGFLCTSDLN